MNKRHTKKASDRDHGCEFCDNGYHLSMQDMYGDRIDANFCPVCGRELRKEEN